VLARTFAADYGVDTAGIALVAAGSVPRPCVSGVFYRFKGGKGVATALGILCAIDPWLGLATLASWLVIVLFFRMVSLALHSLRRVRAVLHRLAVRQREPAAAGRAGDRGAADLQAQGNIQRLLAGQESRIGGEEAGYGVSWSPCPRRASGLRSDAGLIRVLAPRAETLWLVDVPGAGRKDHSDHHSRRGRRGDRVRTGIDRAAGAICRPGTTGLLDGSVPDRAHRRSRRPVRPPAHDQIRGADCDCAADDLLGGLILHSLGDLVSDKPLVLGRFAVPSRCLR